MADLDKRWELYLWSVGPELAMPRETFDLIATNRPDLGVYGVHRVWQTPPVPPRDSQSVTETKPKGDNRG